jgi:hypothetical protein
MSWILKRFESKSLNKGGWSENAFEWGRREKNDGENERSRE